MCRQLANAEEFQDEKSNGLLGEIFIRYSLRLLLNNAFLTLWITLSCSCNNVLYIISFHFNIRLRIYLILVSCIYREVPADS